MSVTVSFKGGRELDAALRALGNPAAARRAARAALEPEAEVIRLAAVALAPNDPKTAGNLKQAIQKKSSQRASHPIKLNNRLANSAIAGIKRRRVNPANAAGVIP